MFEKGKLYVINKRIQDLNKDKDNYYGKNIWYDIPKQKEHKPHICYRIGQSRAKTILELANVSLDKKDSSERWGDFKNKKVVSKYAIEGNYVGESINIKINGYWCYRGIRHRTGLPQS